MDISIWLWHRYHSPAWARVLRLKLWNRCALSMASVRKPRVDAQNDLLNILEALVWIFITAAHIGMGTRYGYFLKVGWPIAICIENTTEWEILADLMMGRKVHHPFGTAGRKIQVKVDVGVVSGQVKTTYSVKQADEIYPGLHTRRESRYRFDPQHRRKQRGALKLGQQDRFRLFIDQIDKMPGQGRATAEAEYIEDYFVVIPGKYISSHSFKCIAYSVMPPFRPDAQSQTHQVVLGLKSIRSVLAINGTRPTNIDPPDISRLPVKVIQLRHIRHIAVRQDLVIAPMVASAIKKHPQAKGFARLVNSLGSLRRSCG